MCDNVIYSLSLESPLNKIIYCIFFIGVEDIRKHRASFNNISITQLVYCLFLGTVLIDTRM